ncbi:hypothetical protein [Nesterenkonia ebinurensis]|uniref:hypothetical protein n=1 Tax=Nesterenkonia ebinurensis TaxID=2608252 RepID=UPI00123E0D19|nr:hypothetical protein [Nesterenkonia ebinurensis]
MSSDDSYTSRHSRPADGYSPAYSPVPNFLAPVEQPEQQPEEDSKGYLLPTLAWGLGLILAAVAAVVAIWQVNERLYSPEVTAERYWEALSSGASSEALGQLSSVPSFARDNEVDNLLLTPGPLAYSAERISDAQLAAGEDDAALSFTALEEDFTTELPLTHTGTTWGFFDTWELAPQAVTWFQVEVPGAPEGAIGQIQINGEPVNLLEETARLSALVPTVAEISIDSQWLVGSADHVVVAAEDPSAPVEQVFMELEASEEAVALLHQELAEYFESCNQQVLMPSGCPVGHSTTNQVDADTIEWSFPDPEDFELTFDAEGWHVSFEEPVAEISYQALHHHTGEELQETEQHPFYLEIQVGASGEDLVVSVRGTEAG